MTVEFKAGDKVRVVSQSFGWGNVRKGDTGTIQEIIGSIFELNIAHYHTAPTWTCLKKDIELFESKPTKKQRITTLEETVATLAQQAQVMQAQIDEMMQQSKPLVAKHTYDFEKPGEVTGEIGAERTHVSQLSANELRKLIIEKAVRFIDECKNENGYYRVRTGGGRLFTRKADFIVDVEKRTVVALLKGFKKVHARGIAKCMTGDVFNEHIGKAIALGRALGLDVSEFEQAVQPTDFVVGHCIYWNFGDYEDVFEVYEIKGSRLYGKDGLWVSGRESSIIDDTDAQY